MRSISPKILRFGATRRWDEKPLNLNNILISTSSHISKVLQRYLGHRFNIFILKCDLNLKKSQSVVEVSVVFYKYIQLPRIKKKSLRIRQLIKAGIISVTKKPPISYVRFAQGYIFSKQVLIQVENLLHSIFGYSFKVSFYNIGVLQSRVARRWSLKTYQDLYMFFRSQRRFRFNKRLQNRRPWINSRTEKFWFNPLILRDNQYQFRQYRYLAYFVDLLLVFLYTHFYANSGLIADVIVRGLLRNVKKHKKFIEAVTAVIEFYRSAGSWKFKPEDWRVTLIGKIGSGTIRSRIYDVRSSHMSLQTIEESIEYTERKLKTKFGSIGVKVWLKTS